MREYFAFQSLSHVFSSGSVTETFQYINVFGIMCFKGRRNSFTKRNRIPRNSH